MAFGSFLLLGTGGAQMLRFFYWLFFCLLFVAGFVDQYIQIIPNEVILLSLLLWGLQDICLGKPIRVVVLEAFGALLFSLGILLLVVFIETRQKKQVLGRGDIKLLFVVTLFMGVEKSLYILAFACICFMFFFVFKGKKSREEYIPFGPYIGLSCFLMMIL